MTHGAIILKWVHHYQTEFLSAGISSIIDSQSIFPLPYIFTDRRRRPPLPLSHPIIAAMAIIPCKSSSAPFIFAFFLAIATAKPLRSEPDLRPLMRSSGEKMSHLHFYWHDTLAGPNPSAVRVARGPETLKSKTAFGTVLVIDDPMTVGPDPKSKLLGRAQGLYAAASQEEVGLIMAMNFAFVDGKYNGSTVTVLGRNTVLSKVREMPVVGGSGLFRFARGYAQARTHTFNLTTGDAVVEYHVYVLHY